MAPRLSFDNSFDFQRQQAMEQPMVWRWVAAITLLSMASAELALANPPEPSATLDPPSTKDANDAVPQTLPSVIAFNDFLVLPGVGSYGRAPLHRDAVEALLVTGQWKVPHAGMEIIGDGGRITNWDAASVDESGELITERYRGGYAFATVDSQSERIMILEAKGNAAVYVNGQPRAGDPYAAGWLRLPVVLQPGPNEFLFHLAGSRFSARLVTPTLDMALDRSDLTLPTPIVGESEPVWGAVPIVNATRQVLVGARLVCRNLDGQALATPLPPVQPVSVYKAPFQIPASPTNPPGTFEYQLRLMRSVSDDQGGDPADATTSPLEQVLTEIPLELRHVGADELQIRTFRSTVDGSIQVYAAHRATNVSEEGESDPNSGLILTLHSNGVTCDEFANNYAPKDWAHVVAPMGRRPHGFDWEDWSRIDALEALADARRKYLCDPRRIFLAGHSMGGHGVWHLAVTYPARFAAIGSTSGWLSFWSYGGGIPAADDASSIDKMLYRGYAPSDTLKLIGNLRDCGVCIVHGTADQSVPVAQARFMKNRLADFHGNFVYYEQQGGGHWWGRDTCDAPRMTDFFRHHTLPASDEKESVDFTTSNPGIAHGSHWLNIDTQQEQLRPSRVVVKRDITARRFEAKTINVTRLAIDFGHLEPSQPVTVRIDTDTMSSVPWPSAGTTQWFEKKEDHWDVAEQPSLAMKGPHRYGTFKSVFDNGAILVYGTGGTEEENKWAFAKARYDAETFWYRGNGALEVMSDKEFDLDLAPDRNVVIYGNAETNAAWPVLLSTSPLQVRRGHARVGIRPESGDELAVLFVRPRPGSDRAVVGVVGGTGIVGMKLTNRLRYFISGVAYPDLLIFGPGVLSEGTSDVRALGYFGLDWKVDSGEIVWRDVAL